MEEATVSFILTEAICDRKWNCNFVSVGRLELSLAAASMYFLTREVVGCCKLWTKIKIITLMPASTVAAGASWFSVLNRERTRSEYRFVWYEGAVVWPLSSSLPFITGSKCRRSVSVLWTWCVRSGERLPEWSHRSSYYRIVQRPANATERMRCEPVLMAITVRS